MPFGAQHGRDGGRIHTARHGHSYSLARHRQLSVSNLYFLTLSLRTLHQSTGLWMSLWMMVEIDHHHMSNKPGGEPKSRLDDPFKARRHIAIAPRQLV
jgi:hypothetical protein